MPISPAYTISSYGNDVFKVVAFKGARDPDFIYDRAPSQKSNDTKLANNFSRARSMVLQYGLCNPWDYFFTGTLNKEKFDRYSLDPFVKSLTQFIRDQRKKWNSQIQFLLVPEHHDNGAWHIHGMLSGLPPEAVSQFYYPESDLPFWLLRKKYKSLTELMEKGYLNYPDFAKKFGFCSLGKIRNPVGTAFYLQKYVSKDLSRRSGDLGKHLYFHSRPLKKAEPASSVYAYTQQLEEFCVNDYDFCKTGFAFDQPWYFPLMWDYSDFPSMGEDFNFIPGDSLEDKIKDFDPSEIDPYYEQVRMAGFDEYKSAF